MWYKNYINITNKNDLEFPIVIRKYFEKYIKATKIPDLANLSSYYKKKKEIIDIVYYTCRNALKVLTSKCLCWAARRLDVEESDSRGGQEEITVEKLGFNHDVATETKIRKYQFKMDLRKNRLIVRT